MEQNINLFDCEELCYGSCSKPNQFIFLLFRQKYYKIYVPDYQITIKELMDFFISTLKEEGVILDHLMLNYIDSNNEQLSVHQKFEDFIHKIKYMKLIELEKEENLVNYEYMLDEEIEDLLKQELKPNEKISLRTVLESRKLGKDQPFLASPQKKALNKINILFLGPKNTPYQDGVFQLLWEFPKVNISTPKIWSLTKIYHPNIYNQEISISSLFQITDIGKSFQRSIYAIMYLLEQPLNLKVLNPHCYSQYIQSEEVYIKKAYERTLKQANRKLYVLNKGNADNVLGVNDQQQQLNSIFGDFLRLGELFFESQKWKEFKLSQENIFKLLNYSLPDIQKHRLYREFYLIQIQDQTQMFKLFSIKNNLSNLKVFFFGPKNSLYQGGIYQIELILPDNYPFKPPKCLIKTKIYHPNIKGDCISIDLLKVKEWSPASTIEALILSIISILDDPNPDDPLNLECAQLYINDRESYNKRVVEYKLKYASPSINELIDNILELDAQKDKDRNYLENILNEWIQYWKI